MDFLLFTDMHSYLATVNLGEFELISLANYATDGSDTWNHRSEVDNSLSKILEVDVHVILSYLVGQRAIEMVISYLST